MTAWPPPRPSRKLTHHRTLATWRCRRWSSLADIDRPRSRQSHAPAPPRQAVGSPPGAGSVPRGARVGRGADPARSVGATARRRGEDGPTGGARPLLEPDGAALLPHLSPRPGRPGTGESAGPGPRPAAPGHHFLWDVVDLVRGAVRGPAQGHAGADWTPPVAAHGPVGDSRRRFAPGRRAGHAATHQGCVLGGPSPGPGGAARSPG